MIISWTQKETEEKHKTISLKRQNLRLLQKNKYNWNINKENWEEIGEYPRKLK